MNLRLPRFFVSFNTFIIFLEALLQGIRAHPQHYFVFFTSPNPAPATGDKEDWSSHIDRSSAFLADFGYNRARSAYPDMDNKEDI